jgi:hypothetical protein
MHLSPSWQYEQDCSVCKTLFNHVIDGIYECFYHFIIWSLTKHVHTGYVRVEGGGEYAGWRTPELAESVVTIVYTYAILYITNVVVPRTVAQLLRTLNTAVEGQP